MSDTRGSASGLALLRLDGVPLGDPATARRHDDGLFRKPDVLCAAGRLMNAAPGPGVVRFREWYLAQFAEQPTDGTPSRPGEVTA